MLWVFWLLHCPAASLSSSPQTSLFWDTTILKLGQLISPPWGFPGGSVVVRLPTQETQFQSPIQEDPIGLRATHVPQLLSLSLEPRSHSYWSPQAREPVLCDEKPLQSEALTPKPEGSSCSLQLEKSPCCNEDPVQPKIKKYINQNKPTLSPQISTSKQNPSPAKR